MKTTKIRIRVVVITLPNAKRWTWDAARRTNIENHCNDG